MADIQFNRTIYVGVGRFTGVRCSPTLAEANNYILTLPPVELPTVTDRCAIKVCSGVYNEDWVIPKFCSGIAEGGGVFLAGNDVDSTNGIICELQEGSQLLGFTIVALNCEKKVGLAIRDATLILGGCIIDATVSGTLYINGDDGDILTDETIIFTGEASLDEVVTTINNTSASVYAYNRIDRLALTSNNTDVMVVRYNGTANDLLGFSSIEDASAVRSPEPTNFLKDVSIIGVGGYSEITLAKKINYSVMYEDRLVAKSLFEGASVTGSNDQNNGIGVLVTRGIPAFNTLVVSKIGNGGCGIFLMDDGKTSAAAPLLSNSLFYLNSKDVDGATTATVITKGVNKLNTSNVQHLSLDGISMFSDRTDLQYIAEKGIANGYASLDGDTLVVQNPANATYIPTASKMPIADATTGLLNDWTSFTTHTHPTRQITDDTWLRAAYGCDPNAGLPVDPVVGDRYISLDTTNGWTAYYLYEWDSTAWLEHVPVIGDVASVLSIYPGVIQYTGVAWQTLLDGVYCVVDDYRLSDDRTALSHTINSHDTTATGSQLNILTGNFNADGLHTHTGGGGSVETLTTTETSTTKVLKPDGITGVMWGDAPTSGPLCKWDATTAPTVNNDTTEGYSGGSEWIDAVGLRSYVCVDPSEGAANWKLQSLGDLNQTDLENVGDIVLEESKAYFIGVDGIEGTWKIIRGDATTGGAGDDLIFQRYDSTSYEIKLGIKA